MITHIENTLPAYPPGLGIPELRVNNQESSIKHSLSSPQEYLQCELFAKGFSGSFSRKGHRKLATRKAISSYCFSLMSSHRASSSMTALRVDHKHRHRRRVHKERWVQKSGRCKRATSTICKTASTWEDVLKREKK
jgi:hypothetical protein